MLCDATKYTPRFRTSMQDQKEKDDEQNDTEETTQKAMLAMGTMERNPDSLKDFLYMSSALH